MTSGEDSATPTDSRAPSHLRGLVTTAKRQTRRALMVPRVMALTMKAPRDDTVAWERFWASVRRTGDTGEVLWDSSSPDELTTYHAAAERWLDPTLPLIDLGCGNGRYTRGLADLSSRAVGVDLAPAAVKLAAAETSDDTVAYLAMDITKPDCGPALRERFGEANVFIRGVLHVLSPAERLRVADNIATLVGDRGRVLLAETNFREGSLAYLEHLGATPKGIPAPVTKAIAMLRKPPSHYGAPESVDTFPADRWEVLTEGPTTILTVPTQGDVTVPERIPGYLAVLTRRS